MSLDLPASAGSGAAGPADVTIDRLVLSLPGVDAAAARIVALGLAEGLSGAGLSGARAPGPIIVDPSPDESPHRLAARILARLLEEIG